MRAFALASLLLLSVLAGCADTETTTTTTTQEPAHPQRPVVPFDQMPDGSGHDHSDGAAHQFLWNYNFTAHDPLLSNQLNAAGLHALDLKAGHLFGAMYGSHGASVDGGLQIWDVTTDPLRPKPLGRWAIPGSVGGDRSVSATEDGEFVVIGLEPVTCLGQLNPVGAATSAYLIDARDKSRPIPVDAVTPAGTAGSPGENLAVSTHSVWVHRIQDKDYAFLFGDIYEIRRGEGTGAQLVYVSSISVGHDMYVRDTPWNTTWALTANGPDGLVVYNVTDPAKPKAIGSWEPDDGGDYYFHTSDVAFVDGTALVVLTSEDFNDPHPSPFWVLDATKLKDPAAEGDEDPIQLLGKWHNPYNHTAANLRFSLHNPRFHDGGILSLSSYHAGVFQFDFRHEEFWAEPAQVAGIAYAAGNPPIARDPIEQTVENTLCKLGITPDAPMTMDVVAGSGGVLYLADVFMGLYTFAPSAEHPVFGSAATT